jgi:hypothetical protein
MTDLVVRPIRTGRAETGLCRGEGVKPAARELFRMTGTTTMKTLSLVKGKDHFCFRYEIGQESKVLEALIEMVNRRDLSFDWFDAAVLSHQLGQHLAKELKTYLPKKAA